MRINDKHIEGLVKEVAGEDVLPLVQLLKNRRNVSEFKIAERLGLTVNQVRNMLYRMHEHNLVSAIRKKDKKKGWYIYYWTFKPREAKSLMLFLKKKRLDELRKRLSKDSVEAFYTCSNKCLRLRQEDALECEYSCPECGNILKEQDTKRYINSIKKEIKNIEKELKIK